MGCASSSHAIQQHDDGNVSDNSSCDSPVLARKKSTSRVLAHAAAEIVNISSDEDNEDDVLLIDSSDDETADF